MLRRFLPLIIILLIACFRADKDAPIIEINGINTFFHSVGKKYVDPGYSAWDKKDGDLTKFVEVSNIPDVMKCGLNEVHYNVKDATGNAAREKRRTVIVGISNLTLINTYNVKTIYDNNDTIAQHLSSIDFGDQGYIMNNVLNRGIQNKLNFELSGLTRQNLIVPMQFIDNSKFSGFGFINDSASIIEIRLTEINQDTVGYTLKMYK